MAHICCKTNSDACHTVASLEAAYGSVQQPADNPVTVQTCRSQSHFLSYMMSSECDATAHDIITTPTEARGHTDTTGSPCAYLSLWYKCHCNVQCMCHISSCLHKVGTR